MTRAPTALKRSPHDDLEWDHYIDAQNLIAAVLVGNALRAAPHALELVRLAASATWRPYEPADPISALNAWCFQHQLEVCWPKPDAPALCAPAFPAGHVLLREILHAFRANTSPDKTKEEATPHLP